MVAMKRIGEHSASANGVRSTTANPRELPLPANGDVNDSPRTLHLSIRHDPRVAPALTVVAIAMAIVSTQMAATDPTPTDRMVIRRGRSTTPRNMPAATMRFSALGPAPVREPAAENRKREPIIRAGTLSSARLSRNALQKARHDINKAGEYWIAGKSDRDWSADVQMSG